MALVNSPYKSFLYNKTSDYYTLGSKYGFSEVNIVFYDDPNFRYVNILDTYSGKQAVEVQGYLYETMVNSTWKNNFYSIFEYVIPYYSSGGMVYSVSNYSSTLVKKIVLFKVPSNAENYQLYGINPNSGTGRQITPSVTVVKTGYKLIGFYLTDETSGAFNSTWKYTEYNFRFKYPQGSDYEPLNCGYNSLDGYWYYNNFTVRYSSRLYLFGEITEKKVWEDIVSPNTKLQFRDLGGDYDQWCSITGLSGLSTNTTYRIQINDANWYMDDRTSGTKVDIVKSDAGIPLQQQQVHNILVVPSQQEMYNDSNIYTSLNSNEISHIVEIKTESGLHLTTRGTFKLYFMYGGKTKLNIYSNYYWEKTRDDGTVHSSGYDGGCIDVTVTKLQKYVG